MEIPIWYSSLDEMQPGVELDALVADVVMGSRVEWTVECDLRAAEHRIYSAQWCTPKASYDRDARMDWQSLPPYSTDIAAAWQVVETLKTQEYYVQIETYYGSDEDRIAWLVSIICPVRPGVYGGKSAFDVEEVAPTAQLAICRAALKAVQASP